MDRNIYGVFPDFCYRAFDCGEYAERFMRNGEVRLNCILYCGHIEDSSRCDPTEGKGHTQERGIVTVGGVSPDRSERTIWTKKMGYQQYHIGLGNAVFLLSTCLPEVDAHHMKKSFGEHIVKIDKPRRLAEDIYDYFGQGVHVQGCCVVYNKGEKLDRKLTVNERVDMAYKQKPACFSPDCEFRIVVKREPCLGEECQFLSGNVDQKCKVIEVRLDRPLDYVSLANLE